MAKTEKTVRRSLADPDTSNTDWQRLREMTDEQIAAAVEADPDAAPIPSPDWIEAVAATLPPKKQLTVRLDQDVVDFFQAQGPRYQTRMNAVLRAFMEHSQRAGKK